MATIVDAPLVRPVLGVPTLYTGFVRVFIPKGMAGYSGLNGCGGCCCGSRCNDPRVILQYVNGNLIGMWGYAGSYQDMPLSASGQFELPNGTLPAQWVPGVTSLEAEIECPCNPSEYWATSAGQTTVGDLSDRALREDPSLRVVSLSAELAASKAELLRVRADLTATRSSLTTVQAALHDALYPPMPVVTPAQSFDDFVKGLQPIC